MPNPFTETYRSFSTIDLLEILQHPDQYQPEAIIAAKEEIASRQLDEQQLEDAHLLAEEKYAKEESLLHGQSHLKNTFKQFGTTVINDITPSASILDIDKKIRLICYGIIVIILYNTINILSIIITFFFSGKYLGFFDIFQIVLYAVLIAGVYEFWRKKYTGWIILTAYATFTALSVFLGVAMQISYSTGSSYLFHTFFSDLAIELFQMAIYVGMMYYLSRSEIREAFGISKKTSNQTIIFTSLFVLFLIILFSMGFRYRF